MRPEGRKGWGDEMVLSAIEAEEEYKNAPSREATSRGALIASIPRNGPSHRLPLLQAAVLE